MPSVVTAFVLAGGGSLGAIEVGMLQALTEAGEIPSFVVGTSVGAINAAFFAADPTLPGVERLARMWMDVDRSDVFPVAPWQWSPRAARAADVAAASRGVATYAPGASPREHVRADATPVPRDCQ
ncbi:MAG: patatin-like phospholipase family protein [Gemmatimonadaceae bacterium]